MEKVRLPNCPPMTKHSQWEKSASKPQNKEPVVHRKDSSKIFFLNIDEAL